MDETTGHRDLTIVVPTYNRYPFLLRLLRYYRACGAPCPMQILDSSSDKADLPELTAQLRSSPIEYTRYDPRTLPTPKLFDGVHKVRTRYVVLWADDDLMVPRMLDAGVRFLKTHAKASVVHGQSGLFQVASTDGRSDMMAVGPYGQRAYTEARASARLVRYLTRYTTLFYSVHRTENLQRNLDQCRRLEFGYVLPTDTARRIHRSDAWVELLLGCSSVIQGEVHQLPGLYMMRERHADMDSWEENDRECDTFDWVTSESFSGAYEKFCACLSEALMRQDGISAHDAREVVKQAFWAYLAKRLKTRWHGRYAGRGVTRLQRLREMARGVPGLRRTWRALRSRLPREAWSLEALRRPSSPYHADFMPIYRAVTADHEAREAACWAMADAT